jgi:hypothetical protein
LTKIEPEKDKERNLKEKKRRESAAQQRAERREKG